MWTERGYQWDTSLWRVSNRRRGRREMEGEGGEKERERERERGREGGREGAGRHLLA